MKKLKETLKSKARTRVSKTRTPTRRISITALRAEIRQNETNRIGQVDKGDPSQRSILFKKCLKLATIKNRIPSDREFKKMKISPLVKNRYIALLQAMGFRRKSFQHNITDRQLLEELYQIYKKLKKLPCARHIVEYTKHSQNTYYKRFGKFKNVLKLMQELPVFLENERKIISIKEGNKNKDGLKRQSIL